MRLKLSLAATACPHCGVTTASEEAALAHLAACPRAPRESQPARRERPAKAQPGKASPSALGAAWQRALDAFSERVGGLVLSGSRGFDKISPATVIKLFVAVLALQLAPSIVEKWKLGMTSTTAGLAWLGLAVFVLIVDRIQRHPGSRR
jgi:hypothetical protein